MNLYAPQLIEHSCGLLTIEGDQHHHFRNVLRGKVGDQVEIFDGKGLRALAHVMTLSKKNLEVKVEKVVPSLSSTDVPQLTIGIPKKEYLESILRSAIQIGVTRVNLVQTRYSPWVYKRYPRLDKIMISSLLQSESLKLPELILYESLAAFVGEKVKTILFSTEIEETLGLSELTTSAENIFIGPEGGFHSEELKLFKSASHISCTRIDGPIMKAEVAVPFCFGLATLLK